MSTAPGNGHLGYCHCIKICAINWHSHRIQQGHPGPGWRTGRRKRTQNPVGLSYL